MQGSDNLRSVTTTIAGSPEDCWRALSDATLLTAWLPGLRRVSVIARNAKGLASEVEFEFAASRSYSLLYTYDHAGREMCWEPRMGKRDAVRGFARVEAVEGESAHCVLTYGLEQGAARQGAELELGDPATIVAAFSAWLATQARPARP